MNFTAVTPFESTVSDRSSPRQWVWRRIANLRQNVAIRVMEQFAFAAHHQDRVLIVGPCAVGMDRDLNAVLQSFERVLQKRNRTDAVGFHTSLRDQLESSGVARRLTESHRGLSARNRERLNQ